MPKVENLTGVSHTFSLGISAVNFPPNAQTEVSASDFAVISKTESYADLVKAGYLKEVVAEKVAEKPSGKRTKDVGREPAEEGKA